jgi:hypothetical protein
MTFSRTVRAVVVGLLGTLTLILGVATPAAAAPPGTHGCSAALLDGDRRLGPEVLANTGLTGTELQGYRRTGTLSTKAFLARYWDPTLYDGTGGWIYPPQNGYQLDDQGIPIVWTTTLGRGRSVDRYGSEYGTFLAPTFAPYPSRAIPPSNLVGTPAANCNYYSYRVLKPLPVRAGFIAAWFAQPGGGTQYQLDSTLIPGAPASINVMWLLDQGYLERVSPRS